MVYRIEPYLIWEPLCACRSALLLNNVFKLKHNSIMSSLQQHPTFYGETTATSIMYNHHYDKMYNVILSDKRPKNLLLNPILMPVLKSALLSGWDKKPAALANQICAKVTFPGDDFATRTSHFCSLLENQCSEISCKCFPELINPVWSLCV